VSRINEDEERQEEEVLDLSLQGLSQRKIAEKTGKSLSTVNRILKAANE
jgi:transposase